MPDEDTPTITVSDFGIWLEPGRIITVRRGKVPALVKIAEACSKGAGPSTAWDLIVFVVSEVMSRVEQQLHELTVTIDRLEDEILTVGGDPPLDRVAELQKRIVHARRFQAPLANVVTFLASQADSLVDGARRDEFEGIAGLVAQHRELLGLTIDRTAALQGQIRDRLADSMNTATYRFTWVATVFLPLSFLTGLLGINVAGIPGDHYPLAFWLVCGALALTAAAWGIFVSRMSTSARRRRGPRAPRE
jgi:zinc transporter